MTKRLVIAEKPSVGMSIASVLGVTSRKDGYMEGQDYIVSWGYGHLAELSNADAYDEKYAKWSYDDLPIVPANWKYKVPKDKYTQFVTLKKLMGRDDVSEVINACDAGREGELIFRNIYKMANCKKPIRRLWISSMEDAAIEQGFCDLKSGEEYDNLFAAARCREWADWLVGINATRLFSVLYHRTLNVGRVVSPTLALLVQREADIAAFKPEAFYTIELDFGSFTAASEKFKNKADADKALRAATGTAVVKNVSHKQKSDKAPALYDLTTLQRDANRILGYTAQQTLDYVQSLYEKKLCTYPRTDSRYLTDDMADGVNAAVICSAGICGVDAPSVVLTKQVCNNKKVSDHHAIIPTVASGEADMSALPAGEREIIKLIALQVLRSVSEAHRFCETVAEISCGGVDFTAKGKTIENVGWNTEEVEAESISFAVCAYYGIATGENSFGYIATWSKDKELKELRASLETINKTSSELITDIDRHYAEIMKEREADLTLTEPVLQTPTEEALYLVDDTVYLHVQPTDGGWDYSLYDKESKKLLDGGVIETAAIEESPVSSIAGAVRTEVFVIQGMTPTSVVFEDIAILEDLQAAQIPEAVPIESEAPAAEAADAIDAIARSVQEEAPVQAPANGYMPDPSMSIEAMNAYGYTDSDMLPLSKERALELFERDVPIYMLYDGNTEAMAFEAEDIVLFSGCFGITREDWDAIKDQIPPMDMETIRQKREQAFLESPGDTYAIYQLKRDDATADLRFMNSEWLNKKGIEPQPENYDLIYTGALYPASTQIDTLERLYQTFNLDHPTDFTGHSLSVSDIVALKQNGVVSCHYVDSVGYKELPSFIQSGNYLKNAEMQMEDDYGMIDGIVNNGPRQTEPPVKSTPERAADTKAKKPSVLAKLRQYQDEDRKATTMHRSAERDLL